MSKTSSGKSRGAKPVRGPRDQKPSGYKIGWRASTHISAVEGLTMPRDMHDTFVMFEKLNLTPEQRRKVLREKYGKSNSRT